MGFAYTESFENGIPIEFVGDWVLSTTNPYSGVNCLKSKAIGDNQSSQVIYTFTTNESGLIKFFYRTSSEQSYDKLICSLDNVTIGTYSGEKVWSEYSQTVTAGTHILIFSYSKDSSGSRGEDCAYIDNLFIEKLAYFEIVKSFDAKRNIKGIASIEKNIDAIRTVAKTALITCETSRTVTKTIKNSIDLKRFIKNFTNREFHAKRTTKRIINRCIDAKRTISVLLNTEDITIGSLTLSIGNFADRPYIETSVRKYLDYENITGTIGNYPFFLAEPETTEEIGEDSIRYTLTGNPDMTDALYRDVFFSVENLRLSTLLSAVDVSYDLACDFSIDSDSINAEGYMHENKKIMYDVSCSSLKQFLSNLLDWSNSFYQKQMFCVYRNGQLYVTSREQVRNIYHADNFAITDLSISKSKIRNMTEAADSSGNNTSSEYTKDKNNDVSETEILLNGTYQFGDASVTYSRGLVSVERSGGSETKYEYKSIGNASGAYSSVRNKYLSRKTMTNKDDDSDIARVDTVYEYNKFAGELYVDKETETTYKYDDDGKSYLAEIKITTCVPLGNGHWGQRVETYEYTEEGARKVSVSTGFSGGGVGPASVLSVKRTQKKHHTSTIENPNPDPDVMLQGRPKTTLNCPISETNIFKEYINLYASMNGKKEEILTATLVSENIIDVCNAAFEYKGNLYYMTSNAITKNLNGIRQRISAVRWQ